MEASLYLLPSMRISASAQKNPRDWNQFDITVVSHSYPQPPSSAYRFFTFSRQW